ncbi:MAG: exodeoxyribonuclease VII large subunit [Anaerolineae bacterium]|nr:exodeoxyribonuclease VII large subunit [Anaerolineae bacterium]
MIGSQQPTIFTIRDTNARIRAVLEKETVGKPFWIAGLVRKHFISDWGHEYFELLDEEYTIRCMVRENVRGSIPFSFANGQEVEVCGTIRVYEPRASVEFEVEDAKFIDPILPRLNEDTEARLAKMGLWPRDKRPLPEVIDRIWLVTSKNSDAVRDFENTYREHRGQAGIKIKDVRIQGQSAPRQIADAINALNEEYLGDPATIIVLTRGGGRGADLQVFSDPIVAEAICRSRLFVAAGIGHEANETFADLAADISKGTPTAIAVYLATRGEILEATTAQAAPRQTTSPRPEPATTSTTQPRRSLAVGVVLGLILAVAIAVLIQVA